MPVQEIPIAAVVVVIAWTELYIVQTERFPVFRRRRHLHFDWRFELCVGGAGGRCPRDRGRPKEVPGCRI